MKETTKTALKIVTAFTGLLALILPFTCNKRDKEPGILAVNTTESNHVDSGSINKVKGDQTNIGRDQINNYPPAKPKASKSIVKKSEASPAQININHGGFQNNGGKNNTYNQKIINSKPQPRKLTEEDKKIILAKITSKTAIVQIVYARADLESVQYGQQMADFIKALGYEVDDTGSDIAVVPKNQRFYFEGPPPDGSFVIINIERLERP